MLCLPMFHKVFFNNKKRKNQAFSDIKMKKEKLNKNGVRKNAVEIIIPRFPSCARLPERRRCPQTSRASCSCF